MKLCMVLSPNLTIPAVKGGAIETLVNSLIDANEKEKKFEFTIFCFYDKEAERLSHEYVNTQFIYVHGPNKIQMILQLLYRLLRKYFKIHISCLSWFENKACTYICNNNFDLFINEGADLYCFRRVSNYLGKDKCIAHLHAKYKCTRYLESIYGYILAVSEYIKEEWIGGVMFDSCKAIVLMNCIDVKRFNKKLSTDEKKCLRQHLKIKDNDFVIYFCGRIVPEKGVKELIEAISLLKDSSIKLLLIGSPNFTVSTKTKYEKEVLKLIAEQGENIIRLGYVDNEDLYKYYSISDIAAVPSTYEEPAGLVVLEAMAAETPFIISNSGGMQEYVSTNAVKIVNKEKGLSQNLANMITELRKDNLGRLIMIESALKEVKQYDVANYFRNFTEIIENLNHV